MALCLVVASSGLVTSALTTIVSSDSISATSSQTETFSFTGQNATFTVPNGVFSMVVNLSGAEGGAANVWNSGSAGRGGDISLALTVNPGEVFTLKVGQQGGSFANGVAPTTVTSGGWPDGGDGYIPSQGSTGNGAGGGGGTYFHKVINNVNVLVAVAGGGGGASSMSPGGHGGLIGGSTPGDATPFTATSASGGNQSSGGDGGCITDSGASPNPCHQSGGQFFGGDAGPDYGGDYGGGGGGGGYFGGGAGIGNSGGGGGSSWSNSTLATATNHRNGVQSGNGIATITYTPLAPCTPGTYSATGYVPCVNASLGYFVNISGSTGQTACQTGFTTLSVGSIQCEPIATTSTNAPQSPTPLIVPVVTEIPATTSTPNRSCTTTSGRAISRACLARNANIVIPSNSRISFTVARSSARICRATGSTLRATRKGSCSVTMRVTPRKGKAQSYRVTVSVTS